MRAIGQNPSEAEIQVNKINRYNSSMAHGLLNDREL